MRVICLIVCLLTLTMTETHWYNAYGPNGQKIGYQFSRFENTGNGYKYIDQFYVLQDGEFSLATISEAELDNRYRLLQLKQKIQEQIYTAKVNHKKKVIFTTFEEKPGSKEKKNRMRFKGSVYANIGGHELEKLGLLEKDARKSIQTFSHGELQKFTLKTTAKGSLTYGDTSVKVYSIRAWSKKIKARIYVSPAEIIYKVKANGIVFKKVTKEDALSINARRDVKKNKEQPVTTKKEPQKIASPIEPDLSQKTMKNEEHVEDIDSSLPNTFVNNYFTLKLPKGWTESEAPSRALALQGFQDSYFHEDTSGNLPVILTNVISKRKIKLFDISLIERQIQNEYRQKFSAKGTSHFDEKNYILWGNYELENDPALGNCEMFLAMILTEFGAVYLFFLQRKEEQYLSEEEFKKIALAVEIPFSMKYKREDGSHSPFTNLILILAAIVIGGLLFVDIMKNLRSSPKA